MPFRPSLFALLPPLSHRLFCVCVPPSGLDQTELTLSVAGTLRTGATGPDGAKLSVGGLLRIGAPKEEPPHPPTWQCSHVLTRLSVSVVCVEVNPSARALRVTCRAVHPSMAAALVNTIKALVA